MEDVRDTLWKWAIQLSALAGLGCATLSTISMLSFLFSHREMEWEQLRIFLGFGFVLGPLLGIVWLQMVYMKRWAGWLVWSLATLYAALLTLFASAFHGDAHSSALIVLTAGYATFLFCALAFKPRLWRD